MCRNGALGVMLHLEHVLGVSRHVRRTSMKLSFRCHMPHQYTHSTPDRSGPESGRAQWACLRCLTCAMSTWWWAPHEWFSPWCHPCHSRWPHWLWAPIRKYGVVRDVDVVLAEGQTVLHVEPHVVLGNLLIVASPHKGVPQQHGEAMTVQVCRAQLVVLKGAVRVVSHLR
jgi:hypothetical protein